MSDEKRANSLCCQFEATDVYVSRTVLLVVVGGGWVGSAGAVAAVLTHQHIGISAGPPTKTQDGWYRWWKLR